jgi:hypothetical protein
MLENILDFAKRGKLTTSESNLTDGIKAAARLGATEQLDLNKVFSDGKPDSFFIGRVRNDYGELKENDYIIVNTKGKPKPNSLVLHLRNGDSNIEFFSKINKSKSEVIGVVTYVVRRVEVVQ